MDAAHLHLLLNHVPVLGTLFGLLLFAYGVVRKHTLLQRVGLVVFVASGLSAGAAYLSGTGAEETVEPLGLSESYLEAHENAGFYALVLAGILGLFALGSLFAFRDRLPRSVAVLVLLLALGVSGLMAWTANLGGQIRHPELRPASMTHQLPQSPQPNADADDEDDD